MKANRHLWKWWQIDTAGVLVCVVLTLVFYLAGVCPLADVHEEFVAEKAELSSRQADAHKQEVQLASIRGRLEAVRHVLRQSPLRLEPTSNVNRRLAALSELATGSGLKVDEIQPGPPVPGKHYQTVPIRLVGSGKYRTCAVFLHELQKVFPDTAVGSLDLTGNRTYPGGPGTFRFELLWHASPLSGAPGW